MYVDAFLSLSARSFHGGLDVIHSVANRVEASVDDKIHKMSDTFNTQSALFETKIEFSARDLDKEDYYPCDPTKKA